jgi:hypothetical protein
MVRKLLALCACLICGFAVPADAHDVDVVKMNPLEVWGEPQHDIQFIVDVACGSPERTVQVIELWGPFSTASTVEQAAIRAESDAYHDFGLCTRLTKNEESAAHLKTLLKEEYQEREWDAAPIDVGGRRYWFIGLWLTDPGMRALAQKWVRADREKCLAEYTDADECSWLSPLSEYRRFAYFALVENLEPPTVAHAAPAEDARTQ